MTSVFVLSQNEHTCPVEVSPSVQTAPQEPPLQLAIAQTVPIRSKPDRTEQHWTTRSKCARMSINLESPCRAFAICFWNINHS